MKKIIAYKTVTDSIMITKNGASGGDFLQLMVEQEIKQGWQPLGGVSVVSFIHPVNGYVLNHLYQAMVKYEI